MLINRSQIYGTQLETDMLSAAQSVHYSAYSTLVYYVWENGVAPENITIKLNANNVYVYQPEQEYKTLKDNIWTPPLTSI